MLFLDLSLYNMPAGGHALKIRNLPTGVHKPLRNGEDFSGGGMNADGFFK